MSIISLNFLIFISFCLLIYYIVPRKVQWIVLLVFSIAFFVMESGTGMLIILLGIVFLNWGGVLLAEKYTDKKRRRQAIYISVVVINLSLLILFKDINFFPDTINAVTSLFGYPVALSRINILAPAGISYFTLTLIGYVTDVYWRKFPPQKNVGKMVLFASYFPIMTSGPIMKYDLTGTLMWEEHKFDYGCLVMGAERILWGFFKKLVIAERIGIIVETVYVDYLTYSGWYVLIAVICFGIELYTDFSGAIDIVLGVSECFGITLSENFDLPFWSLNISEFWRRWHITLGNWLREYVFYPILRSEIFRKLKKWCRNKLGKDYEKKYNLPVYLGMLITWFLIGFWHGGRWNYIFGSGLYYWLLITMGEVCSPVLKWLVRILHINTDCSSYRIFQRVRTFCVFAVGLSFFRASSLRDGYLMWKGALLTKKTSVINNGTVLGLGLDMADLTVLIIAVLILIIAGIFRMYLRQSIRVWFNQQNLVFKGGVITAMLLCIILFGVYGPGVTAAEFIYQQF